MTVDKEKCLGCGSCIAGCPVEAIAFDDEGKAEINKDLCIGCGSCLATCPVEAIEDK